MPARQKGQCTLIQLGQNTIGNTEILGLIDIDSDQNCTGYEFIILLPYQTVMFVMIFMIAKHILSSISSVFMRHGHFCQSKIEYGVNMSLFVPSNYGY